MWDIRQSQQHLIDQGYFTVNSNGEFTYISPKFCDMFGIEMERYLGKHVSLFSKHQTISSTLASGKERFACFEVIFGKPCLIYLVPLSVIDHVHEVFCQVIFRADDTHTEEFSAFLLARQTDQKEHTKNKNSRGYTHQYNFNYLIGESAAMHQIKELVARVAKSNSTILLSGESGTGKELFAHAIHDISSRREGPFVPINCAAIPGQLFESELFGYEGGAFSGARREGKLGRIELAQHGTLFLDEISELPLQEQGKLLRVLQEREIDRLGGTTPKVVDIRIIAASNRDLRTLVQHGQFREDLYYRLHVFELKIPPLRQRKDDILLLTYHFIHHYNHLLELCVQRIDPLLEEWLLNYHWPGNVRELKYSVERAMYLTEGDTLTLDCFQLFSDFQDVSNRNAHDASGENAAQIISYESAEDCLLLEDEVAKVEISAISRALSKAGGDRALAAQMLGIHVASLYRKINKYKLS